MRRVKEEPIREERITMEVVVDAYNDSERAMGWYYYLEEAMRMPFRARVIDTHPVSPLKTGEEVEVLGMPAEEVCYSGMFVLISYGKQRLAVPLSQLQPLTKDENTLQAVSDWHYWVGRKYQF